MKLRTLRIDEDDSGQVREIKVPTLVLGAQDSSKDIPGFAERLSKLEGLSRVKTVEVDVTSARRDLDFLRGLPNVETVSVFGSKIVSLDGLAAAKKLKLLKVETVDNRSRSLSNLSQGVMRFAEIRVAREQDFEDVGRAQSLEGLTLKGCKSLPTKLLEPLHNINSMTVAGGTLPRIVDTASMPKLSWLLLGRASKLETLEGDNSGIASLLVDSCKAIDWVRVSGFAQLETLRIMGTTPVPKPSALRGFRQLHSVYLDKFPRECGVWPESVRELNVNRASEAKLKACSIKNPEMRVIGPSSSFLAGRETTSPDNRRPDRGFS